jgi:hypothetical protein
MAKKKHPADINQKTKSIDDTATTEVEDTLKEKDEL